LLQRRSAHYCGDSKRSKGDQHDDLTDGSAPQQSSIVLRIPVEVALGHESGPKARRHEYHALKDGPAPDKLVVGDERRQEQDVTSGQGRRPFPSDSPPILRRPAKGRRPDPPPRPQNTTVPNTVHATAGTPRSSHRTTYAAAARWSMSVLINSEATPGGARLDVLPRCRSRSRRFWTDGPEYVVKWLWRRISAGRWGR